MKKTAFNCIVLIAISSAYGQVSSTTTAKLSFDEKKAFPFPKLILGSQEEVFLLPAITKKQYQYFKSIGQSMLRYPCGTPSDWFAWDNVEKGYWDSEYTRKAKKMHPKEYYALCKQLGMEPLITVNTTLYGEHGSDGIKNRINPTKVTSIRKGADYAARWVEDANIKHKAGIKYWEIGNETWIWMRDEEYPIHVREYSKAMRKVDPSIKIIACGLTLDSEFYPTWLRFPNDPSWKPRKVNRTIARDWTMNLLTEARGSFDYLAPHIYMSGETLDPFENGKGIFAYIHENPHLKQQIEWIKEAKSPVRIAVTEWMTNVLWQTANANVRLRQKQITQDQFNRLSEANSPINLFFNGLLAADWIGTMAATGYVDIAIAHNMIHGIGKIWNREKQKYISPTLEQPVGTAIAFWNKFKGEKMMPVTVANSPTYEYKGKKIPLVSAYATITKDGKVNVILINRSPDKPVNVDIPTMLGNRKVIAAKEYRTYAKSWDSSIWPAAKDPKLHPVKHSFKTLKTSELKNYPIQPSSLTCVELTYDVSAKQKSAKLVKNIAFIGNSITRHAPSSKIGWTHNNGMAATGEDKDYVHLVYKKLCDSQPSFRPELKIAQIGKESNMTGEENIAPCKADIIVIQLGDNYRGKINVEELQKPYEMMIEALKGDGEPIVFCVGAWGQTACDPFIRTAAKNQGAIFVDIGDLRKNPANMAASEGRFTHSGVNWHPGNRGMQEIAKRIWAKMEPALKTKNNK